VHSLRCWVLLVLTSSLGALVQSGTAQTSKTRNRIVAQEVVISGTSTLDTAQLNDIANSLTAVTMRDDESEVKARIRNAFQERGYFDADVTNLDIRVLDPLANRQPVRIEAEVREGPLFKFAGFNFTGNQAISADELRKMLPLHVGEIFSTGKVRSGLDSLRQEYSAKGFLEFYVIPETDKTGGDRLTLTFDIAEGKQYRMEALDLEGKSDLVQQLQPRWELKPGAPFDPAYLENYLDDNGELLPEGFDRNRDVQAVRDCRERTVNVHIELDPKRPWKPGARDAPCEQERAGQ
jgi:outer membrane protein assembly factor BamA